MNEQDRCWCGSMLKDKPHNCIGTRGRVEELLDENAHLRRQVCELTEKSGVLSIWLVQEGDKVKSMDLESRELLDTLELLTAKLESEGETHPFVGLARGVVTKHTEKRKCECVWLDGGIVGEYRDPKVPCPVHDKKKVT